jgi:hypothetical protein
MKEHSQEHYKIILNLCNERADADGMSTTQLATMLGLSRKKLIDVRNGDTISSHTLFELFDLLYPDKSMQERAFISENVKGLSLPALKSLYKNKDKLFTELQYIKKYQYDDVMNEVLRKICIKNSKKLLNEVKQNEM